MKNGIELIAQERSEQIKKHGFDITKDKYYSDRQLFNAALYVLTNIVHYYPKGWGAWFSQKMKQKEKRLPQIPFEIERLKIAGALIAAEIDRLQYLEQHPSGEQRMEYE